MMEYILFAKYVIDTSTNLLELKNKKAINSFKTDKTAANGNLRLNLKSKPQAKCHWSLSIGLTPKTT